MTPWVQRLLFANVVMFFVQMTRPDVTDALKFVPALALTQPWTLVTYMFLHGGFGHLFWNMFALYIFGPQVEARMGSRRFLTLYMIGGLSGAVMSSVFSPYSSIIGASAATYAVTVAFAWFWPYMTLMLMGVLPIQARWLVSMYILYSLYSGVSGSGGGIAHFAHLGGVAGAYVYLRAISSQAGMKRFKKRAIGDVPPEVLGNWSKVDPATVHELNRDEVNRLLEKIRTAGVGSLTAEEKMFLSNFVPTEDRVPPVS